jgi:hypothetical protein
MAWLVESFIFVDVTFEAGVHAMNAKQARKKFFIIRFFVYKRGSN